MYKIYNITQVLLVYLAFIHCLASKVSDVLSKEVYETFCLLHFENHYALDTFYKLLPPTVETKRNFNHLRPKKHARQSRTNTMEDMRTFQKKGKGYKFHRTKMS